MRSILKLGQRAPQVGEFSRSDRLAGGGGNGEGLHHGEGRFPPEGAQGGHGCVQRPFRAHERSGRCQQFGQVAVLERLVGQHVREGEVDQPHSVLAVDHHVGSPEIAMGDARSVEGLDHGPGLSQDRSGQRIGAFIGHQPIEAPSLDHLVDRIEATVAERSQRQHAGHPGTGGRGPGGGERLVLDGVLQGGVRRGVARLAQAEAAPQSEQQVRDALLVAVGLHEQRGSAGEFGHPGHRPSGVSALRTNVVDHEAAPGQRAGHVDGGGPSGWGPHRQGDDGACRDPSGQGYAPPGERLGDPGPTGQGRGDEGPPEGVVSMGVVADLDQGERGRASGEEGVDGDVSGRARRPGTVELGPHRRHQPARQQRGTHEGGHQPPLTGPRRPSDAGQQGDGCDGDGGTVDEGADRIGEVG